MPSSRSKRWRIASMSCWFKWVESITTRSGSRTQQVFSKSRATMSCSSSRRPSARSCFTSSSSECVALRSFSQRPMSIKLSSPEKLRRDLYSLLPITTLAPMPSSRYRTVSYTHLCFMHMDRYKLKNGKIVEALKPKYNCFQGVQQDVYKRQG